MYGLLATVNIAAGQFDKARKALHDEVIPRAKKAPGFVKGFWTINADKSQGVSLVVFDTKEHADGAAAMLRDSPPPAGVTPSSVEVREVVGDA